MAKASALRPGYIYEILSGPLAGEPLTIVDNVPVPDGEENQRKVQALTGDGDTVYILPRLLSPDPVDFDNVPNTHTQEADVPTKKAPTPPVRHDDNPISDPMDPRLDMFRPSRKRLEEYIERTMPGTEMKDWEFLLTFTNDTYRANNDGRPANLLFKGDTQSGKTILVDVLAIKWAEAMGYPKPMPVFTLSGSSGVTDYDLFGQPAVFEGELCHLPGLVDLASRCGGILNLDEVTAMGQRVTSSLHSLTDSRHYFINRGKPVSAGGTIMPEIVNAHNDLWIVGSFNEAYRGMTDLNEAFANRFRILTWNYSEAVEEVLVPSPALRILAQALRTERAKGFIKTPTSTLDLQRIAEDIAAFGIDIGLSIFVGAFKPNEREQVEDTIQDRSIPVLLHQEMDRS